MAVGLFLMAEFVTDCPRCGAHLVTFEVRASTLLNPDEYETRALCYEVFSVCRACKRATIFNFGETEESARMRQTSGISSQPFTNIDSFDLLGPVTPADMAVTPPPEHVPTGVEQAFSEAARCAAVRCYNAAGAMFRLCLDLATKDHDMSGDTLFERLQALCDKKQFAPGLRDLATAVRQDGNDGAHDGTLDNDSVEDMALFADRFLTQLYTEPTKVAEAKKRRNKRRSRERENESM